MQNLDALDAVVKAETALLATMDGLLTTLKEQITSAVGSAATLAEAQTKVDAIFAAVTANKAALEALVAKVQPAPAAVIGGTAPGP